MEKIFANHRSVKGLVPRIYKDIYDIRYKDIYVFIYTLITQ